MTKKLIGFIVCSLILLAFAIWILIYSYIHSGSYYCKKLKIKKDSDIDISNAVKLYSLTFDGDENLNALEYNSRETNITKTEIVKVESTYPIIKIAKFNGDKIIIDFNTKIIYTINSGIVKTYSTNIYKNKHNSVYIEAIDEKKNILSTVFGNNAKLLYIDDYEYICDNLLQF